MLKKLGDATCIKGLFLVYRELWSEAVPVKTLSTVETTGTRIEILEQLK